MTVFISGASRSIGLELARLYAADGARVVGNGRSEAPEEAIGGFTYLPVPNADLGAQHFAESGTETIDVLVLNAAVFGPVHRGDLDGIDVDRLAHLIEVNALSHLRVLMAALPFLKRSKAPKVGFIVSKGGIARNMEKRGSIYYRTSKACQMAIGFNMIAPLTEAGIIVRMINPGSVRTRIGGKQARLSAAESAVLVKKNLDGATLDDEVFALDFDGSRLRP